MPNPVPLRGYAKDDSTLMDDFDFALVIEGMYQGAADPDRWEQLIEALAPLSDLLDYLGDKPREVRIFPGVGHMLAPRHWDDMLRQAAA
jgi:uncharacterized protein YjeT (DUF2065 family)